MTTAAAAQPVERFPQVVLFLVNPLILFPFVTDQALLRWLLVALSLAVAVVASRGLAARMRCFGTEVWPLAGLSLVILVHVVRGAPAAEGFRWLVLVVLGATTYLYCRTLDASERQSSLRMLVMAGGAIGAYAVLQAVGLDVVPYATESWMYRVVTTFGHRNFTATFLVVALFCGFGLVHGGQDRARRWPAVLMTLVVFGLLATGSRFPILAATFGAGVFFGASKRLRWVLTAALLVLAGWLVVIAARGEVGSIVTRTETFVLRAELYRSMLPLMVAEPVLGLGPGGFARGVAEAVGPRLPEDMPGLVFMHAHLLPAELVIDFGVAGLGLALLFVLPIWVRRLRRRPGGLGWLGWAHVVWLLINLYDVSFFSYAGWVTLWPLLAFMRSEDDPGPPAVRETRARRMLRTVVAVPMIGAVFVLAPMFRSSALSFRGATALTVGNGAAAAVAYENANAVWPLPLEDRYRRAVATLRSGETELAVERLLAVENEAPGFSAVRYNLAMAHARLGRLTEAALWNERHLGLHPRDRDALAARDRLRGSAAGRSD